MNSSSNLNAWAQLVSVGAAESSPCALFGTEKERVMVNVGEGTQRLCMEHRVRLARLQHIMLTDLSPDELGGLPGMLLTLADINLTHIVIHGPVGLRALLHSTRHFMRREELRIEVREHAKSGSAYQGEHLSFKCIVLSSSSAKDATAPVLGKRPRSDGDAMPTARPVLAYLCETAGVQGKFLLEKAKALNIPPGPLYGKLKAGQAVELPDGRTIRPDEVVGPATPGAASLVVGLPHAGYLDSLSADPTLSAFSGAARRAPLSCVLHFTPPEVCADPKYREWMASLGGDTTHVMATYPAGAHRSPFRAARMNNLRLHLLNPTVFPQAAPYSAASPLGACEDWDGCKVVAGDTLLKFNLVPLAKAGLDHTTVLPDITADHRTELEAEPNVVEGLNARPEVLPASEPALGDGEVVFLGTGSAVPSKYRNVTGIYIRLEKGGMLLDCGEGSFHQLRSLYSRAELKQVLKGLRAIWISHSHADHHLGLMKVLQERRKALEEMSEEEKEGTQNEAGEEGVREEQPVLIMAPGSVLSWLREYKRHVGDVPLGESSLVDLSSSMTQQSQAFLERELGISRLTNVGVDHCKHAYGVVLDSAAGWRLVYSGDCRPSERLVAAGKGAQVLIHEATFEVGKQDEALARKHCTVEEAVGVARRMGAQAVILTHFSQRYPKFPVLPSGLQLKICVAFDLMKAKFSDLPQASALLPALQRLFPPEEEDEMAEATTETAGKKK